MQRPEVGKRITTLCSCSGVGTHCVLMCVRVCAGASFSAAAASTQTIVLANAGNSSVTFNASATPTGLFGGWISMAPSTGMLPGPAPLHV